MYFRGQVSLLDLPHLLNASTLLARLTFFCRHFAAFERSKHKSCKVMASFFIPCLLMFTLKPKPRYGSSNLCNFGSFILKDFKNSAHKRKNCLHLCTLSKECEASLEDLSTSGFQTEISLFSSPFHENIMRVFHIIYS